jgi:sigma-E factor negative regulatory protein RseA
MKLSLHTSDLMSALVDGQLNRAEVVIALEVCKRDDSALLSWSTYHLIGEVLRLPGRLPMPAARSMDMAFVNRLNQRLAREFHPMDEAQQNGLNGAVLPTSDTSDDLIHLRGEASNDGNYRWKLVAGLASLAAVTAIAWNVTGIFSPAAAPQLAQISDVQQVVVATPQGPMVRNANFEELLAAHRQLGSNSALQLPSGFLRNATFEVPQNSGR